MDPEISRRVRAVRDLRGLKRQQDLADLIGLKDRGVIGRLEDPDQKDPVTAWKVYVYAIAAATGVFPHWLLTGEGEMDLIAYLRRLERERS